LLEKGAVKTVQANSNQFVKLILREKKNGSFRPVINLKGLNVINLKGLNAHIPYQKFNMETCSSEEKLPALQVNYDNRKPRHLGTGMVETEPRTKKNRNSLKIFPPRSDNQFGCSRGYKRGLGSTLWSGIHRGPILYC